MKELKVRCISGNAESNSIDAVSELLDTFERHKLEHVPWVEFPDKPKVSFTIAYNLSNVFLKFYVKENNAAGTRLRKGLQEIKKLASEMRKEISGIKNEGKTTDEKTAE